jgi:hypothetical protein
MVSEFSDLAGVDQGELDLLPAESFVAVHNLLSKALLQHESSMDTHCQHLQRDCERASTQASSLKEKLVLTTNKGHSQQCGPHIHCGCRLAQPRSHSRIQSCNHTFLLVSLFTHTRIVSSVQQLELHSVQTGDGHLTMKAAAQTPRVTSERMAATCATMHKLIQFGHPTFKSRCDEKAAAQIRCGPLHCSNLSLQCPQAHAAPQL